MKKLLMVFLALTMVLSVGMVDTYAKNDKDKVEFVKHKLKKPKKEKDLKAKEIGEQLADQGDLPSHDYYTPVRYPNFEPYNGIVQLTMYWEWTIEIGGHEETLHMQSSCSGILIDSQRVLTAGHCLFDDEVKGTENDGFPASVKIAPARDGDFFWGGYAWADSMVVSEGWSEDYDYHHDWGVLFIDEEDARHHSYHFDYKVFGWADDPVKIIGYPSAFQNGFKMYEDDGFISRRTPHNFVLTQTNGYYGMSGGAVLDANNNVIGIITNLAKNSDGIIARRITPYLAEYLDTGLPPSFNEEEVDPNNDVEIKEEVNEETTIEIYTVTWEDWNGTVLKTEEVPESFSAEPPLNEPYRTGYTFTGWTDDHSRIESDMTITAEYTINNYTVTFKDWDNTVLDVGTVNYGSNATPPTNPERTAYNFIGWSTSYTNITSNKTITAEYEVAYYTVTYEDWDGTILSTQSLLYGEDAVPPADPYKAGATFVRWDHNGINITEDTVIEAVYSYPPVQPF